VNQLVGSHVEFFPSLFFKKNTPHLMLAWLVMLEKLLRLDFHHMCKEATSAFSSIYISVSFQNSRLSFPQLGENELKVEFSATGGE